LPARSKKWSMPYGFCA